MLHSSECPRSRPSPAFRRAYSFQQQGHAHRWSHLCWPTSLVCHLLQVFHASFLCLPSRCVASKVYIFSSARGSHLSCHNSMSAVPVSCEPGSDTAGCSNHWLSRCLARIPGWSLIISTCPPTGHYHTSTVNTVHWDHSLASFEANTSSSGTTHSRWRVC